MCNHNCNQGRNCDCKPQMEVCPAGTLAELARLREQLAAYASEMNEACGLLAAFINLSAIPDTAAWGHIADLSIAILNREPPSTAHLEAYGEQKRREGMEEAARIAWDKRGEHGYVIAEAIRAAMKGAPRCKRR